MSGVDTRTRVERLQSLGRRAKHDLAIARRQESWHEARRLSLLIERIDDALEAAGAEPVNRKPVAKAKRKTPVDHVGQHLRRLGVTSNEVKTWAVSVGLVDKVRRGRIRAELVQAYEDAHQPNLIERNA